MTKSAVKSRFDSSGEAQPPIAPTLTSLLKKVVREYSKTLRVCLPARVQAVLSDYRVDVQPVFLEKHGQSSLPTSMPLLPRVPVAMPHGALFSVRYPLSVGDCGFVIIADRSIDSWLAGDGSPTDPNDARLHDLTDAIFVPGLLPDASAKLAHDGSSDIVFKAGLAQLRMQQAGTFVATNGAVNLVAQIQALAGQVSALSTIVAGLSQDPITHKIMYLPDPTALPLVTSTANQIAAAVGTLKGS